MEDIKEWLVYATMVLTFFSAAWRATPQGAAVWFWLKRHVVLRQEYDRIEELEERVAELEGVAAQAH